MSKLKTAINLLRYNRGEFLASILMNLNFLFPDKLYLSLLFRCKMGYWIDWKNPKTFSEKLQWLKLYDRKPIYTMMVDKYAVKEYVAKIIGKEYIIPTLGLWDSPEDIDWDSLPDKFVLKTTHGGGSSGVVICNDKSTFDKADAIAILKRSWRSCIYKSLREWPYKNVDKKILAEKLIEDPTTLKNNTDLTDYKFYCFNGNPAYCQVIRNRRSKETIDFYDMKWDHMPFIGLNPVVSNELNPVVSNGLNPVVRPTCLSTMVDISSKLSIKIPFSRVDFYIADGKIYFGEITFYPASGLGIFTPIEWNEKLGSIIKVPFEN